MINREVRLPLHVILSPQVNEKDNANEDMEEENATLRETTENTRITQEQRKLKERVDSEQNAKEYIL